MESDYKKKYLAFRELSFGEKKMIVLEFLELLNSHNETLAIIYEYIQQGGEVDEKDLFDIYEAVLFATREDNDKQIKQGLTHLDILKDKILEARQIEEIERMTDVESAKKILLDF